MDSDDAAELETLRRKIFIPKLIGSVGTISMGLGIGAMFGTKAQTWHPLFSDPYFVYSLLILGAVLMIWMFISCNPHFKRIAELKRKIGA